MSLTIPMASKHYTEANKSIAGWLNGLLVSIQNHILRYVYVKYTQVLQSVPNTEHKDDSFQDNTIGGESIENKDEEEGES